MTTELKRVLIEGFQEEKIEQLDYDTAWAQIYAARQNNLILQSEMIGIERKLDKPCAVVAVGNVRGYIPLEFSGVKDAHELRRLIGEQVAFKIETYDREGNTFIGNRNAALEHMASATWKRLEQDKTVTAVVRQVERKMAVLDIGGIEVELPAQEYGHGWTEDMREVVQPGDHIRVKIVELDKESKKVVVSKKAAEESPWPDCTMRYTEGAEYVGRVSGVAEYGVFVNLEPGVDALVPHMRFGQVRRGSRVVIRIRKVDVKKQRIHGRIVKKL
jgi:ribosomal protein S1